MSKTLRSLLVLITLALWACLPVQARVVIRGGLTHERSVELGETYYGDLVIENVGDEIAHAKIYQADYTFDAEGYSHYDELGSVERSNGSWIAFTTPRLTLGPNSRTSVPYSIRVPADATLTGTYWSLLMVEEIRPDSPELPGNEEPTLGVVTNVRYAIQLVTHIGDTGREDFRLAAMKLEAQDAEHLGLLRVDLENTGEKMIRAEVRVELFDLNGESAGAFLADARRTYPNTSVRYSADLSSVPLGAYKMLMLVRLASGSVYASEYDLGG